MSFATRAAYATGRRSAHRHFQRFEKLLHQFGLGSGQHTRFPSALGIRHALAHALFDVDLVFYRGFAHTVYDRCPPPCNAPHMLAERFVEELDYARFVVVSTRETLRENMTPTIGRMELFDHIQFALDFGGQIRWAKMGDPDPAIAGEARRKSTEVICEALTIACVVLRRRKNES